jgi:hypothetical protein
MHFFFAEDAFTHKGMAQTQTVEMAIVIQTQPVRTNMHENLRIVV